MEEMAGRKSAIEMANNKLREKGISNRDFANLVERSKQLINQLVELEGSK